MDLLEEQIRIKSAEKNREMTIQGQKVKWAYRSEVNYIY